MGAGEEARARWRLEFSGRENMEGEGADWGENLGRRPYTPSCEIPRMPSVGSQNHRRWHVFFTVEGQHRTHIAPQSMTEAAHPAWAPPVMETQEGSTSEKRRALFIASHINFDPTAQIISSRDQTARICLDTQSDGP